MTRTEISQEKLDGYISAAEHFAMMMVSPLDGRTPHDQKKELLDRIDIVCNYLKEANQDDIINLEFMPVRHFVKHGTDIYEHRFSGSLFIPNLEMSASAAFIPQLSDPQQFFADATREVRNMALAIKHEPNQRQVSKRILSPYNGKAGEWRPAKLAA